MSTENKRAVIYCRVSTKEQVEEGNSLSTQEKICKEYALKNGYDVAEVFIEQGESAKTQDRTELQRLLSYCAIRKNGIHAVISYKIDRISRNTDDYSQIRILLKRYGVEIKSTSEYFENTPAGRFMENIIANVAQFDNDVRSERCAGGMKDAMREGRYVWFAPLGYDNIHILGRANIAPNNVALLVREAFETISLNTYPIEQVRKQVTEKGLVNRAGKPISRSQFYKNMKNEIYAGWIIKFGERHKGLFEPIVSQEIFDQVQRVLKHRARKNFHYMTANPDFPLRRFIHHPSGKKLTGSWSKGRTKSYAYYRFHIRKLEFRKEILENIFKKYLDQFRLNEKHFAKLKHLVKENLVKQTHDQQKESEGLRKKAIDLKEKQRSLIQKNLNGVISDSILRQQLELIEEELLNVNARLARIPDKKVDVEELLDFASDFLKNPSKIWEKAGFQSKLKLQWFNFPKGIAFDGVKFGTTEICSLFNVNMKFSPSLSREVDFSLPTSNQNSEILEKKKEYWEEIGNEIISLAEIMKEAESPVKP